MLFDISSHLHTVNQLSITFTSVYLHSCGLHNVSDHWFYFIFRLSDEGKRKKFTKMNKISSTCNIILAGIAPAIIHGLIKKYKTNIFFQ